VQAGQKSPHFLRISFHHHHEVSPAIVAADAAGIKLARRDEMSLVILKPVCPGHVGVLDMDDAAIGRLFGCYGKVIRSIAPAPKKRRTAQPV
jgi:hypothetical protein